MNAVDILKASALDGLSLTLTDEGRIQYAGPAYAVRYWLPYLQKHMAEIAAALAVRKAGGASVFPASKLETERHSFFS